MDVKSIKLSARTIVGKKVALLRRKGIVPVHVYGTQAESISAQIEDQTLNRLLLEVGSNIPVSVEVEGQDGADICFVREVQRHPVKESILHVDFLRVDVNQTITAQVPVVFEGTAPGITQMGGVLLQNFQSLLVEALPMEIPAAFNIDISGLIDFEVTIQVSDVESPENVSILNDPDALVVRVTAPRIEIVEEEEEIEGEEGLEGEEGEGEEGEGEEESEE
ncbi:MAG: 50S ribosomal protein L25 [Dehalococcoidia bacterium]|nr:50S ribosomal protein L25 [Dehalococcoidia bacterium]